MGRREGEGGRERGSEGWGRREGGRVGYGQYYCCAEYCL